MKTYIAFIKHFQTALLSVGIIILTTLPAALTLKPDWFSDARYTLLYSFAHFALFLVMLIRPLADIFRGLPWLRPLVILRKGVGVFSASIIVSFILAKLIADTGGYLSGFISAHYWSLTNLALFAHLADLSAILLLITSNNLSKRLLGKNWKRIQRLSYVYFYGSGLYVAIILGSTTVVWYLIVVTLFTALAWLRNHGYILQTHKLQTT